MAASELERYSNKRKIEEMLNEDEKLDPALVAFWGIEDNEAQVSDQDGQSQRPSRCRRRALPLAQRLGIYGAACRYGGDRCEGR